MLHNIKSNNSIINVFFFFYKKKINKTLHFLPTFSWCTDHPKRRKDLTWATRFNIILGVARGLYPSRFMFTSNPLDLKVSNILLDEKMNPKISEFGLARIFEGTLDLANTGRVAGTL